MSAHDCYTSACDLCHARAAHGVSTQQGAPARQGGAGRDNDVDKTQDPPDKTKTEDRDQKIKTKDGGLCPHCVHKLSRLAPTGPTGGAGVAWTCRPYFPTGTRGYQPLQCVREASQALYSDRGYGLLIRRS